MIIFQNKGLIDIRAVTTFGVSSKETENAIGFFGTGLKYAIAIILRRGGAITIYRGIQSYSFDIKRARVRVDEFDIVTMNGQELGFTTKMGQTWEVWQAFRELYCNTLDEKGKVFHRPERSQVLLDDEHTTVIVEGLAEFDDCFEKRGSIVLTNRAGLIASSPSCEVYEGESNHIYYRGILAGELEKTSAFTYNILAPLALTEDRTVKNMHQATLAIRHLVINSNDKELLWRWLTTSNESLEHGLDLGYLDQRPSDEWLDVCEVLAKEVSLPLNLSALGVLRKWRRQETVLQPAMLSSYEQHQLEEAKAALLLLGYNVDKHQIVVVDTLGANMLGRVYEKKVLISKLAFTRGTRCLIGTLLEEHLHLEFFFSDGSRDFQNYLIDVIAGLAEQLKVRMPPADQTVPSYVDMRIAPPADPTPF
jgi:hypothetical protein